jgi:hypothetical protein
MAGDGTRALVRATNGISVPHRPPHASCPRHHAGHELQGRVRMRQLPIHRRSGPQAHAVLLADARRDSRSGKCCSSTPISLFPTCPWPYIGRPQSEAQVSAIRMSSILVHDDRSRGGLVPDGLCISREAVSPSRAVFVLILHPFAEDVCEMQASSRRTRHERHSDSYRFTDKTTSTATASARNEIESEIALTAGGPGYEYSNPQLRKA